jgi:hypothetical protein
MAIPAAAGFGRITRLCVFMDIVDSPPKSFGKNIILPEFQAAG